MAWFGRGLPMSRKEIRAKGNLPPSDEGGGFLRKQKDGGSENKSRRLKYGKDKKLSLSHSARDTLRSCQLQTLAGLLFRRALPSLRQMEPRNKVVLTMGGNQCMTGRSTKEHICATPVEKGYARKVKTTGYASGDLFIKNTFNAYMGGG